MSPIFLYKVTTAYNASYVNFMHLIHFFVCHLITLSNLNMNFHIQVI